MEIIFILEFIDHRNALRILWVIAYSGESVSKSKQLTAFLLESDMDGFTRGSKFDKLGMRGSDTGELFFENVRIPKENILGGHGNGTAVLMSGLNLERLVRTCDFPFINVFRT